jgi:hypothetical protein
MVSWFSENMTGAEVVRVSPSGYTNKGICMQWLDHLSNTRIVGQISREGSFSSTALRVTKQTI